MFRSIFDFALMKYAYLQACGAKLYMNEELLDETDVDDVVVALVSLARKVYNILFLFYFIMLNLLLWYSEIYFY